MSFRLTFVFIMVVCTTGVVMGNTETSSSIQDILRRFDEFEERFRKQEVELETLRNKDEALENEIRQLHATNVAMTFEMKQLQSRNTEMVIEIEKLKEKDAKLSIRIAELEDKDRAVTNKTEVLSEIIYDNGTTELTANRETFYSENGKGEEPVKSQQTKDVTSFSTYGHNRIRQAESDMPIAFFATMKNHGQHLGQNQPLVFDNSITNIGNAYHSTTGVFTVPVSGVYVFSTTILSHSETAEFDFTVNGNTMSSMIGESSDVYESLSQTVIFNLKKGDDVMVRNRRSDRFVNGYHYSIFSGFLLSSSPNAQIIG